MYWYMYRTCIGRDPTVQYLKKGIRDTFFGSLLSYLRPPICGRCDARRGRCRRRRRSAKGWEMVALLLGLVLSG